MTRFIRSLFFTTVFTALFALRTASAQNLLINGSFEGTASGSPSIPVGSTVIPGWTTTTAEIAWIINGDFGIFASDGTRSLDLSGYHDSSPYGGITQAVNTTIGSTYRLAFDLGSVNSGNNVSLIATAGSASQTFSFTRTGGGAEQQWQGYTLDFVATGTSTPITLTGNSTGSGTEIGLDNVSVILRSAVVPEAGTLVLTFPALGVLGVVLRRRGTK